MVHHGYAMLRKRKGSILNDRGFAGLKWHAFKEILHTNHWKYGGNEH